MTMHGGDVENLGFESALEKLEDVVRQLENGSLGIDGALAKYEQGIRLLQQCMGLLDRAERKIEALVEIDGQGQLITKPFQDPAITGLDRPAPLSPPPIPTATPSPIPVPTKTQTQTHAHPAAPTYAVRHPRFAELNLKPPPGALLNDDEIPF